MSNSTAVTSNSQPVFNFGDSQVRLVVRDGEPWFVANDVCTALGYTNTSKAVGDHLDGDEKSNQSLGLAGKPFVIINESGLYALVLRSRKPEARKFAKWVTREVLPAIRKTGQYQQPMAPANPALDYTRISPAQAQDLREIVQAIVEAKIQGHGETWARLHRKFRVNSYLELPATRHVEARQYLIAKLPSGYAGELFEDPAPQPINTEKIKHAYALAAEVSKQAAMTVFNAMVDGDEASKHDRWMFRMDWQANDGNPKPCAQPIQGNAMVVSLADLPGRLMEPGGMMPTNKELADLAAACNQRLAQRMQHEASRLGQLPH